MFFLFIFDIFAHSEELPFKLERLISDHWNVLISEVTGQYGNSLYQFTPKPRMDTMLSNNSLRIEFELSGYSRKERIIFHANITDNIIELFNENLDPLVNITASYLSEDSIIVRGNSLDNYSISGVLSPQRPSMLILQSRFDDKVKTVRLEMRKLVTSTNIITRLLPSFFILLTLGFGRIYRKRFWAQYSLMNTRTLQRRINEAKSSPEK